ncbi:MAG: GHKL domain-containing protein [Terrisporobacter sp.]
MFIDYSQVYLNNYVLEYSYKYQYSSNHSKINGLNKLWCQITEKTQVPLNTKCNDIKISNHKILTTKNNRNRHGIGLKSVSSSLDKYGGTVAIEYNDKEFIIKILIPIIKKVK